MWNYYRDEPNSGANNGIKYRIRGSKSFDYKRKFVENVTAANSTKEDVEVVIPFKHFSNFWRTLDIPLINCEIPLTLTWCKNCILISKEARDGNYTANPILPKIDTPRSATFQMTNTILYVPVLTLSEKMTTNF